jgi:hypothetical protein
MTSVIDSKLVNTKSGVIIDSDRAAALALTAKRSQFQVAPCAQALLQRTVQTPQLQDILNTTAKVNSSEIKVALHSPANFQIVTSSIRLQYNIQVLVQGHAGGDNAWDLTNANTSTPAVNNADNGLCPWLGANAKVFLPAMIAGEQFSDVRCTIDDQSSTVQQVQYVNQKQSKISYPVLYQINEGMLKRRFMMQYPSSISIPENYMAGPSGALDDINNKARVKYLLKGTDTLDVTEPLIIEGIQDNNGLFKLWTTEFSDTHLLPPGATLNIQFHTSDSAQRWLFAEAKINDGNADKPLYWKFSGLQVVYDLLQTTPSNNQTLGTEALNRMQIEGPVELYGASDVVDSPVVSRKSVAFYQFGNVHYRNIATVTGGTAGSASFNINTSDNDPLPDILMTFIGPADSFEILGRQTSNQSFLRFARPNVITAITAADYNESFADTTPAFCIYPDRKLDMTSVEQTSNNIRMFLNQYFSRTTGANCQELQTAFELICRRFSAFNNVNMKGNSQTDGLQWPVGADGTSAIACFRTDASECVDRDFAGQRHTGIGKFTVNWNSDVVNGDALHIIAIWRHSTVIDLAQAYSPETKPNYVVNANESKPSGMFVAKKMNPQG